MCDEQIQIATTVALRWAVQTGHSDCACMLIPLRMPVAFKGSSPTIRRSVELTGLVGALEGLSIHRSPLKTRSEQRRSATSRLSPLHLLFAMNKLEPDVEICVSVTLSESRVRTSQILVALGSAVEPARVRFIAARSCHEALNDMRVWGEISVSRSS